MKRIFKVSGLIVFFLLAVMILPPIIFKGKIVQLVKDEINKNVNAQVDFSSARLSLFRSFPDFNLALKRLQVVGKEEFTNDTLLVMDALAIDIDLFSVFRGAPYEIKKIILDKPSIKLLILQDGSVNYDIIITSASASTEITVEETPFTIGVKEIIVNNGKLIYDDKEINFVMILNEVNGSLSGDFSTDLADMEMELLAKELSMSYENFEFLSKIKTNFKSLLIADLNTSTYSLQKTEALLNNLPVSFNGYFILGEEDYEMDFSFKSGNNDLKSILSIIPALYTNQFDKIETSGAFSLDGKVSGIYNETSMPGFTLDLAIDNGTFKYPDLPKSAKNINVELKIANESGILDETIINLERFQMTMADNPLSATLMLKTPISNPDFKFSLNGKLDFTSLTDVIPLPQDEALAGVMDFNIIVNAKMLDIENKQYNQIIAEGTLEAKDIKYHSSLFALPIELKNANVKFNPSSVDLAKLDLFVGKSDFKGSGWIDDFLPYYLADGTLKGMLNLKSELIDVNELLSGMLKEENTTTKSDSAELSLILPEKIDFSFTAQADKLLYADYELSNITSIVAFKDQIIEFNPLKAELLGGTIQMTGEFNGSESESHPFGFDFNLIDFDIPLSYKTIGLLNLIAPIAEKTNGKFSTGFRLKGEMDNDLNLNYETLLGGGILKTTQISITSVKTLEQLANLLGNEKYGRLITDGLNFSFEILNGKVYQKPFKIKYADSDITIGGNVGFDRKIDFDLALQIPYQALGKTVQTGISQLISAGENLGVPLNPGTSVLVNAKINGLLSDPKVQIDYKDFLKSKKNEIESKFNEELEKQKQELREKVSTEAEKYLLEAKNKADAIIAQAQILAEKAREEAQKAAEIAKNEANKQADRLIEEANKKGMVASLAAKEAAKKIRLEGENTSNKIIAEADKKANDLISKAKLQADEIISSAEENASKI